MSVHSTNLLNFFATLFLFLVLFHQLFICLSELLNGSHVVFVVAQGGVKVLEYVDDQGHQISYTLLTKCINHCLQLFVDALSK